MRLIFDKATESSYDVIVTGVAGISFTGNGMVVVLELCGKNLSELETWQNACVDYVSLYDMTYKRSMVLNYTKIHGIFPTSIKIVDNEYISATFSTDHFEDINKT